MVKLTTDKQTVKQTDRQTDRTKTICPDHSIRGHKTNGQTGQK